MNNGETTLCEGLIEYMTGESSDMQRKRFEKHLAACSACKEEAALWHEVWDRLAEDAELVDPPADLKEAVLSSLINKNDDTLKPAMKGPKLRYKRFLSKVMRIAVLILVFLAGWMVRDIENIPKQDEAAAQLPSNIETLFHLTADRDNGMFNESPRAYGVACLVRSEDTEQLIVYIFGSPPTQSGEAYQVWLWNKGQRTSAGTFTVGASGIGIMTLPVTKGLPDIDAVGVTLEEGEFSSTPHGPRMFSSEEQLPAGDV
ncbi:anti-sigma factor domain-containing protein [Cohnella sp.]|uniref:anti-sigma factor n=1 Tax=Cohnella sp. TaxID=1883426 RepID=UPI003562E1F0